MAGCGSSRANGNCVWACGEGTQPDFQTNECSCQPNLVEKGKDRSGWRICACAGAPYQGIGPNGNCVWSCAQGTQPNWGTKQCDCLPGYVETGKDTAGRRVCRKTT